MKAENKAEIGLDSHDPIRDGFTPTVKAQFSAAHPVQELLVKSKQDTLRTRRQMLAATYGSHFPLNMMMEQEILKSFHQLPGFDSEPIGLMTLASTDLDIGFEDVYGNPEDKPEFSTTDLHSEMEKRLNLK